MLCMSVSLTSGLHRVFVLIWQCFVIIPSVSPSYIYSRVSNLKYQVMDLVIPPKLILTDPVYALMFIVVSLAVVSGLGTK